MKNTGNEKTYFNSNRKKLIFKNEKENNASIWDSSGGY